jgi:acetyl-CoA acetyltransferase
MSEYTTTTMPPPLPEFARKAAIVGVGESDYGDDYRAERAKAPGWRPRPVEELIGIAFERALADAGLDRSEIDGIATSYTYGGPAPDAVARQLGITPRYLKPNGHIMAGPLPVVCADIALGEADTVAMIYAVCPRTSGRVYGGTEFVGSGDNGTPDSYYYHLPWGFSSQAAHWSLMFSHYAAVHGATEQDLGHVAIQVREHAALNPAATMRKRLTMEDYLASRYIVAPLRLYDICLVNDGAVCVIVRKAELAKAMAKPPVLVAGWGAAKIRHSKLHAMVRERLRLQMEDAGGQALAMAGRTLDDIGHFEAYDAASMHLINQVEGYGFVPPGQGFAFCRDGQMTLGGRLPSNMGGGNLSGAYLQGWSQVAEVVRQLRGEAGERQVTSRRAAMSSLAQTDQAHPVIYELGE